MIIVTLSNILGTESVLSVPLRRQLHKKSIPRQTTSKLFNIFHSAHHNTISVFLTNKHTHNCHYIHNNILKNTKLLHVSDLNGPLSGSTLIIIVKDNYSGVC